jgi:hypothetical protein
LKRHRQPRQIDLERRGQPQRGEAVREAAMLPGRTGELRDVDLGEDLAPQLEEVLVLRRAIGLDEYLDAAERAAAE